MKKRNILVYFLGLIIVLSGCQQKNSKLVNNTKKNQKIKIMVTFNPISKIVEAIGKDKIDVETIIPEGMEPHNFEPKVQDLKNLNEADVFIYNGLGMENWVESTLQNVDNKNIIVERISKGCKPIKNTEDNTNEYKQYDPHVWLGIKEAEIQVKNVKEILIKVDKKNKEFYEKNYQNVKNELEQLYSKYSKKFHDINNKKFVTGHAAFGYLCRNFGLEQKSVQDVFAEEEPSISTMKKLVDYCRKYNIKTVFVEDMVSTKISKTLAKEVNAKVSKINTLENNKDDKNYIEIMKENLQKIYESIK